MKNEILTFSPADNELLLSEMEMLEVYGGTGAEGDPNTYCGNAKCKCTIISRIPSTVSTAITNIAGGAESILGVLVILVLALALVLVLVINVIIKILLGLSFESSLLKA